MVTLYIIVFLPIVSAQYVRGIVGGSAQLPCRREDIRANINWIFYFNFMRNNEVFIVHFDKFIQRYSDNRIYLMHSYHYANLTFENLSLSDSGIYICTEYNIDNNNEFGIDICRLMLTVVDPFIEIDNISVNVGDLLTFNCIYNSTEVWVYKDSKFTMLPHHNTSQLLIYNVSLSDSGIYYCFKDTLSYSIRIIVEPIPTTTAQYTTFEPTTMNFIGNVYYVILAALVCLILLLIFMLCKRKFRTAVVAESV